MFSNDYSYIFCIVKKKKTSLENFSTTPFAKSFMKHHLTNIILALFSIRFVLNVAQKFENRFTNTNLMSKNVFE